MLNPIILPDIDPVVHIGSLALQWGPLAVRWYGLAYLMGVLLGVYYGIYLLRQANLWQVTTRPMDESVFYDLVLWLVLGILLGGRLGYMFIYNLPKTLADPASILRPWEGGMAFHGALIGITIAGLVFAKHHKFTIPQLLSTGDLLSTVAPIGLFFGRLANFTNGELWGRETQVPWAVVFCNNRLRDLYGLCPAGEMPRHPSQLYEAGLEGIGLLIVAFILWKKYKAFDKPGLIWGTFLAGYGLIRIFLENFRNPDEGMPQIITMGMVLSVPMVAAGAYLIYRALKKPFQAVSL